MWTVRVNKLRQPKQPPQRAPPRKPPLHLQVRNARVQLTPNVVRLHPKARLLLLQNAQHGRLLQKPKPVLPPLRPKKLLPTQDVVRKLKAVPPRLRNPHNKPAVVPLRLPHVRNLLLTRPPLLRKPKHVPASVRKNLQLLLRPPQQPCVTVPPKEKIPTPA